MVETQRAVPLLATRDLVLFPGMLAPIFVERDKGVRALEQTQQSGGLLVMAAQRSAVTDDPEPDDIHSVGTLAKVVQFSRLSDGTLKALIEGKERVIIDAFESVAPFFTVRYTPGARQARRQAGRACGRSWTRSRASSPATWARRPQLPEEAETALEAVTDPEEMVNVVASNLMIGPDRKQELLEGEEPEARLLLLLETLIQENEFIALENEISERVHDSFERQQRRVFLHERLKVLQEELGEEGEEDSERGAYLKQLAGEEAARGGRRRAHQGDQAPGRPAAAVGRGGGGQDLPGHRPGPALGGAAPGRPSPTWPRSPGCSTRPTTD